MQTAGLKLERKVENDAMQWVEIFSQLVFKKRAE